MSYILFNRSIFKALLPLLMVLLWIAWVINLRSSDLTGVIIFTLIQIVASWNAYAFLFDKKMIGYGIYLSDLTLDSGKIPRRLWVTFSAAVYLFIFYLISNLNSA